MCKKPWSRRTCRILELIARHHLCGPTFVFFNLESWVHQESMTEGRAVVVSVDLGVRTIIRCS